MHFLGKQPSSGVVKIAPNKEQAKELNIKKNWKTKSTFIFLDNIWSVDWTDMQLLSKFNKGICFLLCDIDVFSTYAWVVSDKHGYSDYGTGFDARPQFLWQTVAGVKMLLFWGFLIVPLHMSIKKTIYWLQIPYWLYKA